MKVGLWIWKKITNWIMRNGDKAVAYQLWGYIQGCVREEVSE